MYMRGSERKMARVRRILVIICVVALFLAGAWVRKWAWESCEPIRFGRDMANARYWGMRVNSDGRVNAEAKGAPTWSEFFRGYRDIYERELKSPHTIDLDLDYSPLRLAVFSLWTRWTLWAHPDVGG